MVQPSLKHHIWWLNLNDKRCEKWWSSEHSSCNHIRMRSKNHLAMAEFHIVSHGHGPWRNFRNCNFEIFKTSKASVRPISSSNKHWHMIAKTYKNHDWSLIISTIVIIAIIIFPIQELAQKNIPIPVSPQNHCNLGFVDIRLQVGTSG